MNGKYKHNQKRNMIRTTAMLVVLLAGLWLVPQAKADHDDIEVTLMAAAPLTYDHLIGGGAFNDGSDGHDKDVQDNLRGAGLTCGDVVTYLALIEVDEDAGDFDRVATFNFSFAAKPNGQPGIAHSAVSYVGLNYGEVENGDSGTGNNPGAGQFGLDSAMADDRQTIDGGDTGQGGSTVQYTTVFAPAGTTPFNGAEELLVTAEITDLDPGESLVLRLDTIVSCQPDASPRGTLKSYFTGGTITAANGQTIEPETIRGSRDSVKLKDLEDATGVNAPLLRLSHTVTLTGGVCGIDDTDNVTIKSGTAVTYCVTVTNLGTDPLFDVEVTDTTGRAVGDLIELSNLVNLDGEGDSGDLLPGATATGQYQISYTAAGNDQRTVTGRGNNGAAGSGLLALSGADAASVIIEAANPTAIELAAINTSSGLDVRTTAITMALSGLLGLVLTGYAFCCQGGLNWVRVRD
ncbi:MAG: DUF11 domain-containing protein [Anaerolineales bacterium]|nr:DUF11 domain-containing protein [Anaerolineales bacterium]